VAGIGLGLLLKFGYDYLTSEEPEVSVPVCPIDCPSPSPNIDKTIILDKKKHYPDNVKIEENINIPYIVDDGSDETSALLCVVCIDRTKDMLFYPCMHVSCCGLCGEELKECPMCRGNITKKSKIYL